MSEGKSLFSEAVNEQGYLKMGLMGFPGSGKSKTSSKVAIGLWKYLKEVQGTDPKPVYVLDTEKGFDYLVDDFKEAGVPLRLARTRAFSDLLLAVDEAEKNGSMLLLDSVTHFWEEVQSSYKKANNKTRLSFADWGPLKSSWARYTEKYLNSRLHIIMAGRAGDVYDFIEDDDGKMQLHKTGTKMQAEKNLGYEPGLAIEMERVNKGDFKKGERNFVNRAHILKDRFDILDGQMFDNPTFETFLPHIQRLNLGVHRAIDSTNSTALFAKDSKDNWAEQRKKAEILCEEIQGVMVAAYPGRTTEEVQAKNGLLQEGFGTYSWTAVQGMDPDQIAKGLAVIKEKIAHLKERPVGHTNGAKVKKGVEA